jgi:dTDP-4-dehydrorhamnose reductase
VKVLVTGAGGMLGRDVVRAALEANHEVAAYPRAELDVTDGPGVARVFKRELPGAVVHCAAYTDVDGAEGDPARATAVNADGARNVAAAAEVVQARVIYSSTDYVFDGRKGAPYVESDEPAPESVYGRSKLAGEHETAAATPLHMIVRTSWLFGTGGQNFVETMLSLAAELGEVMVVRDQVGCPTYTGHLAQALVRLCSTEAYGIHHIAGAGECSWFEFAGEIFRQADVECRVLSSTTDEFPRPAPRPPYSVLETERSEALRLPDWQRGLSAYLAERAVAA